MKSSIRFCLLAATCAAMLFIAAFSFLPVLVHADTEAEKAIKKAEADTAQAEQAAKEAAEAQKAADEAGKKAGKEQTPEDKAADDAAKAAAEAAEKADEAQDKAQEEQLEAEDAAKDAKEAGGSNEERNKKAADEKKEADDAAEAAKKAEEDAAKKEREADAADKKADDADKKNDLEKKARLKRKRARAARRAAAKAIRDARRLLHEATRTGSGSETNPRKKRLDDLAERLKLIKLAEDARQTEEPPKKGNFIPPGDGQSAESKTANGLNTVTFKVVQGRVIVRLPDDIRAGDTISGTVITEPKGETPEERAKNQNVLLSLAIEIDGKRVEPFAGSPEKEREAVIQQTFWIYTTTITGKDNTVPIAVMDRDGQTLARTNILIGQMFDEIRKAGEGMTPSGAIITPDPKITQPTHPSGAIITPDPKITQPTHPSGAIITPDPKITQPTHPSGAIITPDPKITQPTHPSGAIITPDPKITQPTHPSGAIITPDPKITQPTHPSGAIITPDPKITNPPFSFPPVGQTGRPIVVTGPFDGNAANTDIRVSDGEDRDTMGRFDVIAESPRKSVFAAPANVIGPIKLHLTEGNTRTTGNYRNVGVNLSAPKTNLLRGEQTVLKVEVNGLEGITEPVPLQLDATGVINMDGGNFQNLRITPTEVNRDGIYTTTRAITGQQAGAFTVVATVIVDRFDVCITDDSNRHSGIQWNTFTGDYIFTNPGSSPKPVGQPPSGGTITPGGTPPAPAGGTSLTGTGTMARKGCVIVLTHNAPDRRVFSRLDTCTKTGDATVQTTTPKATFTITDRNVTDNTCSSK
ncbi:MAG: hypothetical protein H7Z16_10115 [Pyrinomonadaceae bacterium]|nr:hypothetical protein [Pyrinomonadaceae bacterium]